MKRDVWLYVVAFVVGVAAWIIVSNATGKREAWDSDAYFSLSGVLSLPSILTARAGAFVRGKWFGRQSA
jgi:uncharacterized membrane protein